jgi:hypothetical protein
MMRRSLLVACLALVTAGCWESPLAPTVEDLLAQVVVQITEPANGAVLNSSDIVVRGTYSPAGLRDDIWLFVVPEQAGGTYYHQSPNAAAGDPATVDRVNQRWSVPTGLGGPPQSYQLVVYIANEAASLALRNFLITWTQQQFFPGLSPQQLPAGLIEKHRITVRRAS